MIRKIDIQQKRASQDGRFLWVTDFGDNNYCSVKSANIPFMTQELGTTFWADVTEKTNKKGETYFMVDKAAATEEGLQPEPEMPRSETPKQPIDSPYPKHPMTLAVEMECAYIRASGATPTGETLKRIIVAASVIEKYFTGKLTVDTTDIENFILAKLKKAS